VSSLVDRIKTKLYVYQSQFIFVHSKSEYLMERFLAFKQAYLISSIARRLSI